MFYLAQCSAESARTERSRLIARTIAADGKDCLVLDIQGRNAPSGRWRNLMMIDERHRPHLIGIHVSGNVIEVPVYKPSGYSLAGLFDKGWRAVPEKVARRFMGMTEPVTS
jgi:hypothetical protein